MTTSGVMIIAPHTRCATRLPPPTERRRRRQRDDLLALSLSLSLTLSFSVPFILDPLISQAEAQTVRQRDTVTQ